MSKHSDNSKDYEKRELSKLIKDLEELEKEEKIELSKPSEYFKSQEDLDLDEINRRIRNIQSIKSKLKKQKTLSNYNYQMNLILQKEQILKEIRNFVKPEKIRATQITENNVKTLNLVETQKALKSLQSKKTHTKNYSDNSEYLETCEKEQILIKHRQYLQNSNNSKLSVKDISDVINTLESLDNFDKENVLTILNNLKK